MLKNTLISRSFKYSTVQYTLTRELNPTYTAKIASPKVDPGKPRLRPAAFFVGEELLVDEVALAGVLLVAVALKLRIFSLTVSQNAHLE
jgi:hypothetical protein